MVYLGMARPADELLNDGKNNENLLSFGQNLRLQMYSPLRQINKSNVKRLVPIWLNGSYDPELDLVYWGVGNSGPYDPKYRGNGDALYTNSVVAIRPKMGEIEWHYQFTPNDLYGADGNNENVIADLRIGGQMRKVIMKANKNGFFYVVDRTNGKLIAAHTAIRAIHLQTTGRTQYGHQRARRADQAWRRGRLSGCDGCGYRKIQVEASDYGYSERCEFAGNGWRHCLHRQTDRRIHHARRRNRHATASPVTACG